MRILSLLSLVVIGAALAGCSTVDQNWVKTSLQESVQKCGGEVSDLTLVREGLFSNKHDGYATVTIAGREYMPDVTVYSDSSASFYRNQDACALHEAGNVGRELQQSINEFSGILN